MNLPLLIPGLLIPLLLVLCAVIHAARNKMKPVTMTKEQRAQYTEFAKKVRAIEAVKRAETSQWVSPEKMNF